MGLLRAGGACAVKDSKRAHFRALFEVAFRARPRRLKSATGGGAFIGDAQSWASCALVAHVPCKIRKVPIFAHFSKLRSERGREGSRVPPAVGRYVVTHIHGPLARWWRMCRARFEKCPFSRTFRSCVPSEAAEAQECHRRSSVHW